MKNDDENETLTYDGKLAKASRIELEDSRVDYRKRRVEWEKKFGDPLATFVFEHANSSPTTYGYWAGDDGSILRFPKHGDYFLIDHVKKFNPDEIELVHKLMVDTLLPIKVV